MAYRFNHEVQHDEVLILAVRAPGVRPVEPGDLDSEG